MNAETHRVRVVFRCRSGHEHQLCIDIRRGVPPELRCPPAQEPGFGGGDAGCQLPEDFSHRVERELRDSFQESKRRGHVLVEE
jgi:hypothetical protein